MESEVEVSKKSRVIRILAVLIGLLLIFQIQLAPPGRVKAASSACTYLIPNDVEIVDGLGNYAQIQPGDVLCLPAGERGNIKFRNLNGADGNPITIRNEGGKVIITGERFSDGGISLSASSNIHVTGSGVASKCGSQYTPEEQDCGFELRNVIKGITVDTASPTSRNIEIDHVHIHRTSTITDTVGIAIHPVQNQLHSGFYVHHNYVSKTSAEALYIGSEPHGEPFEVLGKLENVEVSYNLIENTGYDGIKIKVAIQNVQVHHNVIRNSGTKRVLGHQGGIKIAFSVGDYYNNLIIQGCEGIRHDRTLPNLGTGTRYFNNVVVDTECGGIEAAEENAQIYHNTIVRTAQYGIYAKDASAVVFNNIVVDTRGTSIVPGANLFDNFTGSKTSAGFVDPDANDFHLLPESPSVDAANPANLFPNEDYDGALRPQGNAADLGAFEYVPQTAPSTTSPFRAYLPIVSVWLNR